MNDKRNIEELAMAAERLLATTSEERHDPRTWFGRVDALKLAIKVARGEIPHGKDHLATDAAIPTRHNLDIRNFSISTKDSRCLEVWFAKSVTDADRAALLAAINGAAAAPASPYYGKMAVDMAIEACAHLADDFAAYEQTVLDRAYADDTLSESGRESITSAAGSRQVAAEQIAHDIRALATFEQVAMPRFLGSYSNDDPRKVTLIFAEPLTLQQHSEMAKRATYSVSRPVQRPEGS